VFTGKNMVTLYTLCIQLLKRDYRWQKAFSSVLTLLMCACLSDSTEKQSLRYRMLRDRDDSPKSLIGWQISTG